MFQSSSSGESEFCDMRSIDVESAPIARVLEWHDFKKHWTPRSDSTAVRATALS